MAIASWVTRSRELARLCPVMADLHRAVGPPRMAVVPADQRFRALVRMIVYQQLAGSAAAAIFGRLEALLDGRVTPQELTRHDPATLKACGLSAAKLRCILDLAAKTADGTVAFASLARRDEQRVIEELTQVIGIGEWTAQMFLMFVLRRPDVWPVLDLGVRTGYRLAYDLAAAPTARELLPLGDRFAPYRSIAAWYLWRAVDRARDAARAAASKPR